MSRDIIKQLITLCMLLAVVVAHAQPVDNSPLSRIGIGEPADLNFTPAYAMGGLGSAFWSLHNTNLVNPASLGHLEATALEAGMYAKRSRIQRGDFASTVWSGNLDYLSLSFPILNPINELLERREREFSWGMNISLLPFSRVGYSITSTDNFDSIGVVGRTFEGTGGLYRFNFGNGFRYRDLAFGFNLGYVFGRTSYRTESSFDDIVNDYRHITRSDISYRSFVWDLGAQYDIQLGPTFTKERTLLTVGAHYHAQWNFDTERDDLDYVRSLLYADADTAVYLVEQPGTGRFPSEFGIGVRYQQTNSWSVGIDYQVNGWNNYFNDARPDTLKNTWRIGVGGSYTPDFSSISSYFSRLEYRAGFFYQTDPRVLEGEQAFRYGVTAGVGLPFVFLRSFSYVNLGLEYGRAGTKTTLKENYFRIRVGLVLNDNQWFLKRRYQ